MRMLLVEDEQELAGLIGRAVQAIGFACDHFATIGDAQTALSTVRYDLVVLDLGLPDGDGLMLLRGLRRRGQTMPLLVLTARDAVEDRIRGLEEGADDYVLKPFHMKELLARIKALLRRPNQPLGLFLAHGNVALDTASRQVTVAERVVGMSPRETALLEILLRRPGAVVTKDFLEENMYGFGEEVGPNAIEVAVHRLRKRMAVEGADVEIHTIRGIGYLLDHAG